MVHQRNATLTLTKCEGPLRSVQPCTAASAGILWPAATALPPQAGQSVAQGLLSFRRHVGCHGRISASDRHVGTGNLRTHTPTTPSKHTSTTRVFQHGLPCVEGKTRLHVGAGAPSLHISSNGCRISWVINLRGNTLPNAPPQLLLQRGCLQLSLSVRQL